jgi:hypothetical protein
VAEEYADGLTDWESYRLKALKDACDAANEIRVSVVGNPDAKSLHSRCAAADAVGGVFDVADGNDYWTMFACASFAINNMAVDSTNAVNESACQCDLLRDVFGNPFRSVTLDPSWRSPTTTSLANVIYAERRFDDMPVLADALEEAGCTNDDILDHCRGPGPHVRGCWVVDLILGKQ